MSTARILDAAERLYTEGGAALLTALPALREAGAKVLIDGLRRRR